MKRLFFLVVIFISVVAVRCSQDPRNDTCRDLELMEAMADTICPLGCDGVCACNGMTYCNECEAMKQGFVVNPGDTIPCSQK